MKITVKGDINPFYVQTLCLSFFPGSKFSEKENENEGEPSVAVETEINENGCFSKVSIYFDGKEYTGENLLRESDVSDYKKMAAKISVGRAFLEAAEKIFGFAPPWGILTGVRPAKLATKNFDAGMSVSECEKAFVNDYGTQITKARLAAAVADTERKIITKDAYERCSVYIAIPFCPSRCSYCSFVSFTSKKLLSLIPQYLNVLISEIHKKASLIKELGLDVATIYIGGGTPTVLTQEQLERLLGAVGEAFDVSSLEEFTLEAGRPDTITEGKLACAKRHGVTRISVNPQTLNNDILVSIGRCHTRDDFMRAYSIAALSGIRDVNIDLIAGLPGESFESFADSVDSIVSLSPQNVTVHTFCVKKAAGILKEGKKVYFSKHETASRSVDYSQKVLFGANYVPYYMYRQKNTMGNLENVGYALPGHEGLYNVYMMEEIHTVFGIGASSVTKLVRHTDGNTRIERVCENKYPYEYLREKGDPDFFEAERRRVKTILDFYS